MTQDELERTLAQYFINLNETVAANKLDVTKLPKPEVHVTVPDVHVPEIKIPEIKIPDIVLPSIPAPEVTVNVDEVKVKNFPKQKDIDYSKITKPLIEAIRKIRTGGGGGASSTTFLDTATGKYVDVSSDTPLPVSASINTAGLATSAKQDDLLDVFGTITDVGVAVATDGTMMSRLREMQQFLESIRDSAQLNDSDLNIDNTSFSFDVSYIRPHGYVYAASSAAISDGNMGAARMDSNRNQQITLRDSSDVEIAPLTDTELRATPVIISEASVSDTPETFEDTSFVTGDSPVVLDCNTALGRNGTQGYIINDGAGDFTVSFSTNGSTFGDESTLKENEILNFKNISVDSIRITWVADSAYRVSII